MYEYRLEGCHSLLHKVFLDKSGRHICYSIPKFMSAFFTTCTGEDPGSDKRRYGIFILFYA